MFQDPLKTPNWELRAPNSGYLGLIGPNRGLLEGVGCRLCSCDVPHLALNSVLLREQWRRS